MKKNEYYTLILSESNLRRLLRKLESGSNTAVLVRMTEDGYLVVIVKAEKDEIHYEGDPDRLAYNQQRAAGHPQIDID